MGSIAGTGAVTYRHMGAGLFAGPTGVPGVAQKKTEKTAQSFSDGTGPFQDSWKGLSGRNADTAGSTCTPACLLCGVIHAGACVGTRRTSYVRSTDSLADTDRPLSSLTSASGSA